MKFPVCHVTALLIPSCYLGAGVQWKRRIEAKKLCVLFIWKELWPYFIALKKKEAHIMRETLEPFLLPYVRHFLSKEEISQGAGASLLKKT